LSDRAIARGLRSLNTPFFKSSALLSRVTRADQRRVDFDFERGAVDVRVGRFVAMETSELRHWVNS
jgi:hypothetical protein